MRSTTAGTLHLVALDLFGEQDTTAIIRREAMTGRLDQIHIYVEDAWIEVASDSAYSYHAICLQTLQRLLRSAAWRRIAPRCATIVDVGVGTGEKLQQFVMSLRFNSRNARRLGVVMIDINRRMLAVAAERIAAVAGQPAVIDAVAARADFAQLDTVMRAADLQRLRSKTPAAAVYLLLGNTFANLNEHDTLDMFRGVMRRGDVLVVSLEFGSIGDKEISIEAVLDRYRGSPSIRRLFSAPLKYLAGAISPLEIVAARGDVRFSQLSKTQTIFARAFVDGREVITAQSNRYDWDQFVALLSSYGLEFIAYQAGRETPHYRYAMFEKV